MKYYGIRQTQTIATKNRTIETVLINDATTKKTNNSSDKLQNNCKLDKASKTPKISAQIPSCQKSKKNRSLLRILACQFLCAGALVGLCFLIKAIPVQPFQSLSEYIKFAFTYDLMENAGADKDIGKLKFVSKLEGLSAQYAVGSEPELDLPFFSFEMSEGAEGTIILTSDEIFVRAAGEGTIQSISLEQEGKRTIVIKHSDKLYSQYCAQFLVGIAAGQSIKRGDILAIRTDQSPLIFSIIFEGIAIGGQLWES